MRNTHAMRSLGMVGLSPSTRTRFDQLSRRPSLLSPIRCDICLFFFWFFDLTCLIFYCISFFSGGGGSCFFVCDQSKWKNLGEKRIGWGVCVRGCGGVGDWWMDFVADRCCCCCRSQQTNHRRDRVTWSTLDTRTWESWNDPKIESQETRIGWLSSGPGWGRGLKKEGAPRCGCLENGRGLWQWQKWKEREGKKGKMLYFNCHHSTHLLTQEGESNVTSSGFHPPGGPRVGILTPASLTWWNDWTPNQVWDQREISWNHHKHQPLEYKLKKNYSRFLF